MFFYFWSTISTSASADIWRDIHCEECGKDYRFLDVLVKRAWFHSPYTILDSAGESLVADAAERKLQKALVCEIGPVPCPECGRVQRSMYYAARLPFYRWMSRLAWVLLLLSPIVYLFGVPFFLLTAGANPPRVDNYALYSYGSGLIPILLAGAIYVGRRILICMYDPNKQKSSEARIRQGLARVETDYITSIPMADPAEDQDQAHSNLFKFD